MGKETWARKIGEEKIPGPSDYTTRTEPGQDSPRYSIKQIYPEPVRKIDPPFNDIPTTVGRDAPKFTIRPQTSIPDGNDNPGPGFIPHPFGYDFLKRKNKTLPLSFRKNANGEFLEKDQSQPERRKRRNQSYNQSPYGPAKYDTRSNPRDKKEPSYTIGPRCGNSWIQYNNNPSSAEYKPDISSTRPSSPRCYIHNKSMDLPPLDTPGPGEYSIPSTFGRRSLSIHPLHREPKKYKTPGPGKYDIPSEIGNGSPKISFHPLVEERKPRNPPGVQYHHIKRDFDEPSSRRSIHQHCKELKGLQTPGPGTYSIPSAWNGGHSARMSPRGSREELWNAIYDRWRSPGPAEYTPDAKPTQPKSPSYTVGDGVGGSWIDSKKSVPSPDQYGDVIENPGKFKRSPRFTIRPQCGNIDPESPTKDAGYVNITNIPFEKPAPIIHLKENLDLIPQ